jgi:hypothetical protein
MAGPGMQQQELSERVFPCVKLRGLPFDVNEDEIRVFMVRAHPRADAESLSVYWRLTMATDHGANWLPSAHARRRRACTITYGPRC